MFTLEEPRAQEDWPDIVARPVPRSAEPLVPLDTALTPLARHLLDAVIALAQLAGADVAPIAPEVTLTGSEAIAISQEALGDLFPAMRP